MLIPSSVTFNADCGNPYTDVLRGTPGVALPGWVTINSVRLRLVNGKSCNCRPTRVEVTVAVAVWRTSAPAATSTVSDTAPTSSVVLTVAGTPASILTLSTVAVRKPDCVTLTV